MSDAAEKVVELRDRIQHDEQELDAAVRDLAGAARRLIAPADWIRQNPHLALTGALAIGWWFGYRDRLRLRGGSRR